MALPSDPISGEHRLTNPGVDDRWTCPNCYADHLGGEDEIVKCACGATLELTIEQQPVCVATRIDPDGIDEEELPY